VHASVSRVRRNEGSPLSQVKWLGYAEHVLARQEAVANGADDALLLNTRGVLVCATAANLFIVQAGHLVTPPLEDGALPGATRALVLEELVPKLGLAVLTHSLRTIDLLRAEEAFLTNTLMGIMPLTQVDRQPIGPGTPGPLTAVLQEAYKESNHSDAKTQRTEEKE